MQRFGAVPTSAVLDPGLSDSELRTLATIATYSDKDGWCYPSQSTLADIRGISRRTIIRHVQKLEDAGYLNVSQRKREDGGQTSNLYQVKLDFPKHEQETGDDIGGVTPECHRGGDIGDVTGGVTPECHTNTPINTTSKQRAAGRARAMDENFGAAATAFQDEIGQLTPMTSELLADAVDEYPAGWVVDAIKESAIHNARKWAYVDAILRRWKKEGREKAVSGKNGKNGKNGKPTPPPDLAPSDIGKWLREQRQKGVING